MNWRNVIGVLLCVIAGVLFLYVAFLAIVVLFIEGIGFLMDDDPRDLVMIVVILNVVIATGIALAWGGVRLLKTAHNKQ